MENMPTRRFAQCPGQLYLNRDTIETLYHLLSVKVCRQLYQEEKIQDD
jgi:hypothetical protein